MANEKTFTLQINDEQRRIIALALWNALGGSSPDFINQVQIVEADAGVPCSTRHAVIEESNLLAQMFDQLPFVEENDPGTLHGLNL